jgi:WD40 repeat protein
VSDVAFNPDGSLLAVSSGYSSIDLWKISAGEPHLTMTLNADDDHTFGPLAFSPDDTLLVASDDKRVAVWRVMSGELLISADLPGTITSLAFAPDGTLMAFGLRDGTIRLWGIPQ